MHDLSLEIMIIILAGGFIAAFIDSVVGGGGIISVPVLLMTGLPPHVALGTNKLAGTMCSLTSTLSFLKSGKINISLVRRLFPFTLAGAAAGTITLQFIPSGILRPMVIVLLLAVALYTLFRKNWGDRSTFSKLTGKTGMYMIAAALGMGWYDGFFGPGTGSFLIFIFLLLGFDFVTAAGNAKVLNFGSNVASLVTFVIIGSVNYQYGIPMGIAMVCGAFIGSRVAIRQGTRYVRPLFICMSLFLLGKQLLDLLSTK